MAGLVAGLDRADAQRIIDTSASERLQGSLVDLTLLRDSLRATLRLHGPSGLDPDDVLERVEEVATAVLEVVLDLAAELARKVDSTG